MDPKNASHFCWHPSTRNFRVRNLSIIITHHCPFLSSYPLEGSSNAACQCHQNQCTPWNLNHPISGKFIRTNFREVPPQQKLTYPTIGKSWKIIFKSALGWDMNGYDSSQEDIPTAKCFFFGLHVPRFPLKDSRFPAPVYHCSSRVPWWEATLVLLGSRQEKTHVASPFITNPDERVRFWKDTTLKINMEPENTPLEKEHHLPIHHFQVVC